jgi:hypothetical protein
MVKKDLMSLTYMFENIVCAIEESKNLAELFVDELAGSLLAHEQVRSSRRKEIENCFQR